MLPDIPLPRADKLTRERNERRHVEGANDRCLICDAPLVGKLTGLNYSNARNVVMDPEKPYEPDSGVLWVGATCAKKVPAGYRIPWAADNAKTIQGPSGA